MSRTKIDFYATEGIDKKVGQAVRRVRESKGVRGAQIREVLGYKDAGSISRLEAGEAAWKLEQVLKLALFLGVGLDELLPDPFGEGGGGGIAGEKIPVLVDGETVEITDFEAMLAVAHRFGGPEAATFLLTLRQNLPQMRDQPLPPEDYAVIELTRRLGLAGAVLSIAGAQMKRNRE